MEENDHKEKQKPNGEMDPFSSFLFGHRKQRETDKESENHSQEQKEHSPFNSKSNRIDDWFLGSRRIDQNSDPATQHRVENQMENLQNNVDVGLLMETIDMLVETTNQFKPLIKEFTPFFNRFIKKFKVK